ncbi:hypothetical protein BH20ACT3_BH20ACT3_09270 [soil metagenome]
MAMALLAGPSLLDDPTRVRQWAEYLCYAMIAVGLAVAWGRGGMLALGQGVFFGLGAYAMGMYLTLEQVPAGGVPEFMSLYGQQAELPVLWAPFRSFWFAAAAAVLVPMAVAALLGWLVFRNRIRGPYFAILTQALTLVFWLLLVGQLELTNGTNGLTTSVRPSAGTATSPERRSSATSWPPVASLPSGSWPDRSSGARWPAAGSDARQREPGPLPRLRPHAHQDRGVRGGRRHGWFRRRLVRTDHRVGRTRTPRPYPRS